MSVSIKIRDDKGIETDMAYKWAPAVSLDATW